MEQVPNIAMFLHESRPNFPAAFSRYLVPIVVRYLTDPNNQVGVKLDLFLLIFTKKTIFTQEGQAVLFLLGVHLNLHSMFITGHVHVHQQFFLTFIFSRCGRPARQRC